MLSSTFPTRSAAMSAVFVKMPPPAFMKSVSVLAPMLMPRTISGSFVSQ